MENNTGWKPLDDYMSPEACVLLKSEDINKPIVFRDDSGRWWIRDPLPAPE
jgi:hypothetical protein